MKRFFALLLCLTMAMSLVALVACDNTPATEPSTNNSTDSTNNGDNPDGEDKTPEQIYNEAVNKLKSLENYSFVTEQTITSLGNEIKQTVISMKNGKNTYVKATNDMDPESEFELWYVNEVYYAITSSGKVMASIPYATYVEKYVIPGSTAADAVMSIPFSWFENITMETEGDLYYIELTVSGKEYKDYINGTALDGMIEDSEDVTYKAYFTKEGELSYIVTEFSLVADGMSIDVVSTTTVSNIGNTTVTAPQSTDGFIDMTAELNK